MPTVSAVLPASLETQLREAAARRGGSVDSVVNAALEAYLGGRDHRLYQISTSTALVEGVYAGAVSSATLLDHGDFGLGTFANLDGEMVIVDGAIYQCRADGSVTRRDDAQEVPFAVATRFHADTTFEVGPVASLAELERACDPHRESDNLFYALRIDGRFERVHARAVGATRAPARFVDVASQQTERRFADTEGTLVGFWSPVYASTFSVPGYHLHFLSRDRRQGGHVLDCRAASLRVELQLLHEYDVRLPDRGAFLTRDLSHDPASDLARTE
ncbi:MAG TPA: acetolactate decarboxylase [Kofleriaceae bacterium]|nr:acetolactate decarboxylase [Kofleriaceae bacterium]